MELIQVDSLIIGKTYYLKSNRNDEQHDWIRLKGVFVKNKYTPSGITTTFSPVSTLNNTQINLSIVFPVVISRRYVFTYHNYRPSAYIYQKTSLLKNIMTRIISSILDITTSEMISAEYFI